MLFTLRILLFLSFFSLLCRLLFGLIGLTQQDDGLITTMIWCVSGWLTFWHQPLYQSLVNQLSHVWGSSWLPAQGRLFLPFINNGGSEVDLSALLGLSTCCMLAAVVNIVATTTEVMDHTWSYIRPWLLQQRYNKRRKVNRPLQRSQTLTDKAIKAAESNTSNKTTPLSSHQPIPQLLLPLTPLIDNVPDTENNSHSSRIQGYLNNTLYPWQHGRCNDHWVQGVGHSQWQNDLTIEQPRQTQSKSMSKIVSPRASIMLPMQGEPRPSLWLPIDGPPTQDS
jgi:hypothetical protein